MHIPEKAYSVGHPHPRAQACSLTLSFICAVTLNMVLWPYGPHIHSHGTQSDMSQHGPMRPKKSRTQLYGYYETHTVTRLRTPQLCMALNRFQPYNAIQHRELPFAALCPLRSGSLPPPVSHPLTQVSPPGPSAIVFCLQGSRAHRTRNSLRPRRSTNPHAPLCISTQLLYVPMQPQDHS